MRVPMGRTTIVEDMHTRKEMMAKEVAEGGAGSGFVALSGGYGTLEELMEAVTWTQLNVHNRPVVAYSVNGFWNGLQLQVQMQVAENFVTPENEKILSIVETSEEVMWKLQHYVPSEGRLKLQWGQV